MAEWKGCQRLEVGISLVNGLGRRGSDDWIICLELVLTPIAFPSLKPSTGLFIKLFCNLFTSHSFCFQLFTITIEYFQLVICSNHSARLSHFKSYCSYLTWRNQARHVVHAPKCLNQRYELSTSVWRAAVAIQGEPSG